MIRSGADADLENAGPLEATELGESWNVRFDRVPM
jgi:hypothetical protein